MDGPDVGVAGEALVDFLPDRPGPLDAVDRFDRRAGGAPANVAVGLARLRRPPWLWTRVGADPFGDFLVERLTAAGVPGRFVERDPGVHTSLAFVARESDGRRFTFVRGADARLDPGRVPDDVLDGTAWLYVGSVSLSAEPARSAVLDLVDRAPDDCTVVFDPNARPELWTDRSFEATVAAVFGDVDVLTATPGDLAAAGITAETEAHLADRGHELGPHTVVLTRGAAGARASATAAAPWGPATATHEGYDVDAVDATGAGDAFVAGAVAALADGERDLGRVLAFADAVAALSTTETGAMAALPEREAVRSFLDARD